MQNRGISRCTFIKIIYFDKYSMSDGNKLLGYPSLGRCTFSMFFIGCWWQIVEDVETHLFQISSRHVTRWWGTFEALQTGCFRPSSLDLCKTVPEVQRNSLLFLTFFSHTSAHKHTHPDTIFESYPLNSLSTRVLKFYLTFSVDVGNKWRPHGFLITPLKQQATTLH